MKIVKYGIIASAIVIGGSVGALLNKPAEDKKPAPIVETIKQEAKPRVAEKIEPVSKDTEKAIETPIVETIEPIEVKETTQPELQERESVESVVSRIMTRYPQDKGYTHGVTACLTKVLNLRPDILDREDSNSYLESLARHLTFGSLMTTPPYGIQCTEFAYMWAN